MLDDHDLMEQHVQAPLASKEATDDESILGSEMGDIDKDDEKIFINVGGARHETLLSTLRHKRRTRLCALAKRHQLGSRREYFFDRHPGVFSAVMDYYRSGELHVPLDVCGAVVKRELDFWQIDHSNIEACCWTYYSTYLDNQKTLADFNKSVREQEEEAERAKTLTGWQKTQMQIWMNLDYPQSSRLAWVYALTSFAFVMTSIAGFCLETLPELHTPVNVTRECYGQKKENISLYESHAMLEYLDYVCTLFFTIELIVRIFFAPNKRTFFKSPMNIIDIGALLPLYVQIILEVGDRYNCLKNHRAVLETLFILRIIRIFRVFHLVKHYKALRILVHAIKASIQELLMLCIFLVIAMLVFSTLIFYAERPGPLENGEFNTIPIGFWWAIITMTTVGYGDVYPKTTMGAIIGGLCAVWGVLLIALTIPVISNNFTLFYLHARTRDTITKVNDLGDDDDDEKDSVSRNDKENLPSIKDKHKRCLNTRTLLMSLDSNSTTDEHSKLLANRNPDDSVNNTPVKHMRNNIKQQNLDETVI